MFELFSSKEKGNLNNVSNDGLKDNAIPNDNLLLKDNIRDVASKGRDLPANNSLLSSSESSTSNIIENHESSFIPPKNLPELAKDLYKEQYEQGQGIAKNSVSSEIISKINSQKNFSTPSSITSIPSRSLRMVPEPSFSAVPKLDSGTLGLLRNNASASIQRQDYAMLNQLSTPNVSPVVGQSYPPQSYPQQSFGQNFVSSQNIDEQKIRNIIQSAVSEEMRLFINALNNSGRFNNFTPLSSSSSALSSASTQSNILTPRNVSTESAYSHDNSLSYNHDSDFGSKLNRLADLERLLSISKEQYDVARNVNLQIEYDLRCKREEVRLLLAKDNHDKGHAKPPDSSIDKPSIDKPIHSVIQDNISSNASNASIITDVSANISSDKSGDMFQLLSKTAAHDSYTMNDKVFFDETINKRNDDLATIPHVLPEVLSPDMQSGKNSTFSSGLHTDYSLNVSSASPISVIRDEDFISELQLLKEVNISDPAKYFYVSGGRILRSINDMIDLLAEISDEDFFIHVNSSKNDFASWIEDVFGGSIVANRIRNVLDRRNLLDLLSLH